MLRINSSFNSTEFQNLSEQIEYAIANKYDILFDEFTVNFNLVPKYNTNIFTNIKFSWIKYKRRFFINKFYNIWFSGNSWTIK
ncbi:DUF2714 domain-containing protein [Mycoplasmopsis felis]|nr:DUF2714 domain-containing protein [Mycoplasmopsis felis]MCU9939445.1 DUF2714 domain-containing protein [Mycoplasmopsis felis]